MASAPCRRLSCLPRLTGLERHRRHRRELKGISDAPVQMILWSLGSHWTAGGHTGAEPGLS